MKGCGGEYCYADLMDEGVYDWKGVGTDGWTVDTISLLVDDGLIHTEQPNLWFKRCFSLAYSIA